VYRILPRFLKRQKRKNVMGTGRTFNKAPRVRPKKKPRERRRRLAVQRKRLIALGLDEEDVVRMDSVQIRKLLNRPAKIAS
jgi:hypothetical protein